MSLRQRLTTSAAIAVGLAVTIACGAAYLAVAYELRGEVDRQLRLQAHAILTLEANRPQLPRLPTRTRTFPQLSPQQGGPVPYVQRLDTSGRVVKSQIRTSYNLAVSATDRRIAAGRQDRALRDVHDAGAHLRLLTVATKDGAVQLARPLNSVDSVLARMRLVLLAIAIGGVTLAATFGRLVTRRVTQPLREVADAAEEIAETDSLAPRLAVRTSDEVGRLAQRFNLMLDRLETSRGALASSVASQRQLVADASHELRTPLTSLRTNIEVLIEDGDALQPNARAALLQDLREQVTDLGALVADIIDLARGDAGTHAADDVRLDTVAAEAVAWSSRHFPDVAFCIQSRPVTVDGDAQRLLRATTNLLDNAAKHSGAGDEIVVSVTDRGITVRDHGAGIAEQDLPHIFDRFYRGETDRGLPGTGLGLAIVRQVAESHGGEVDARNALDGGAIFELRLPAS